MFMGIQNPFHATKILQLLQWERQRPSQAGTPNSGATVGTIADLTAQ